VGSLSVYYIRKEKSSMLSRFKARRLASRLSLKISTRNYSSQSFTPPHLDVLKARLKEQPRRALNSQSQKRAAVLVPLCNKNNIASLLFTLRSHDVSTHKGQVSFPGGIQDPTDTDCIHTALREVACAYIFVTWSLEVEFHSFSIFKVGQLLSKRSNVGDCLFWL